MDYQVIPECYVDTNLIETLVPPRGRYNHQKGCSNVTKIMQGELAGSFALGIIDRDKHQVAYLEAFQEVCNNGHLILHKHPTRHHYIIQITPAAERFILINAAAVNISLEDYGLPSDFEQLKKVAKTVNSKNDARFKGLFRALRQQNAPDIPRLAAWINYLKSHNFDADLDVLRSL